MYLELNQGILLAKLYVALGHEALTTPVMEDARELVNRRR